MRALVVALVREYGAAEKLVPNSAEMIYWHAVALERIVAVGKGKNSSLIRIITLDAQHWLAL
jgi:hypothetical protein